MKNNLEINKQSLIDEINLRVDDKILERSNADLLIKLINQAETLTEAISIAELGTTYKRTGFHFDKRLEKIGNTIKYFKKNEKLSFSDGSGDVPNKLIVGDNYDALLNFLVEYKGRIDVIYIDPPYGKDSMGEFAQTNYNNALTRDNILSMLYPRLLIAKQLLSTSGAIFCSIDDKNYAYVKCLFDEIFEEKNFIGTLIWRKKSGGGQTDENFVTEHEYVLSYRRTADFKWIDYTEEANEESFKYNDNDGKGPFSIVKLEKWGSSAHKEDRPTMYFPITDPDGNQFYPVAPDKKDGRWRVGRSRMNKLIQNDEIYWIKDGLKWIPYEKNYYSRAKGKLSKSRSICMDEIEVKSVDAIKRLVSLAPKLEDDIKDYFEGNDITEPTLKDYEAFDEEDENMGIAGIVQKVIYEVEEIELTACDDFDGLRYLVFEVSYPWRFLERERNMTEEDVKQLFVKYLSIITKKDCEPFYCSVENGG